MARIEGSRETVRSQVRKRAGGRCECMGECGHNHQLVDTAPVFACRAPHGLRIRRAVGARSCWVLAPSPHDPPQMQFIAFEELYEDFNEYIELAVVALDGNQDNRDESNIKALCQFCRAEVKKKRRKDAENEERAVQVADAQPAPRRRRKARGQGGGPGA